MAMTQRRESIRNSRQRPSAHNQESPLTILAQARKMLVAGEIALVPYAAWRVRAQRALADWYGGDDAPEVRRLRELGHMPTLFHKLSDPAVRDDQNDERHRLLNDMVRMLERLLGAQAFAV